MNTIMQITCSEAVLYICIFNYCNHYLAMSQQILQVSKEGILYQCNTCWIGIILLFFFYSILFHTTVGKFCCQFPIQKNLPLTWAQLFLIIVSHIVIGNRLSVFQNHIFLVISLMLLQVLLESLIWTLPINCHISSSIFWFLSHFNYNISSITYMQLKITVIYNVTKLNFSISDHYIINFMIHSVTSNLNQIIKNIYLYLKWNFKTFIFKLK